MTNHVINRLASDESQICKISYFLQLLNQGFSTLAIRTFGAREAAVGAVLCTTGCLVAPSVFITTSCDNQKCSQIFPKNAPS